ncbi:putative Lipase [Seiridium cardinale]
MSPLSRGPPARLLHSGRSPFIPRLALGSKDISALGAFYRGSWSMIPLFYFNLFSEALVRKLSWSNFVATLLKFGGGTAQVPITNIGSSTYLIVQPSFYGLRTKAGHGGILAAPFAHESLLWEPASHRVVFDALSNENSSLGNSDVARVDECKPGLAAYLKAGDNGQHAKIVMELLAFGPTMPTSGRSEVSLRDYASGLQLPEEERDNHRKKEI